MPESRITPDITGAKPKPDQEMPEFYALPSELRDSVLTFFKSPNVIAPTAAVLGIVTAFSQLQRLHIERVPNNGKDPVGGQ